MTHAPSVYEQISRCMVGHEPPKVGVPLGEEAGRQFEGLHRTGRSHRVRRRAHAVLLSVQGYTLDQIADILRVDRDAASRTPDRWEEGGVAALEEVNRAASPRGTPPWKPRCQPAPPGGWEPGS